MKKLLIFVTGILAALMSISPTFAGEGVEPIKTVAIGQHRELRKEYLDKLAENGLYGIVHFAEDHKEVLSHSHLLGWMHGDEPDLTKTVSDALVEARRAMRLNPSTPLYRIVDGKLTSWTVLDPLDGAEITIQLKEPVTVQSLAVSVTVSRGLPVAKQVAFLAHGKEVLKATLANKKGQQKFELEKPATFKELTFKVLSSYPGENEWGSVGEIEGFDASGKNLLLSPPRRVPRSLPEAVIAHYRQIKAADKMRLALVTFTGSFFTKASRYDEATRQSLYPEYVKGCDVAGFDIYPIFGSGYPSRLGWVANATEELVRIAGPMRPVYAWIETNKGSRWMSYSKQLDVEPKHTRCETWMAIIRGATAIGYFTHCWRPDYKQFAPDEGMVSELKRLSDQITRLAPAILAAPAKAKITMSLGNDLPCHFKATEHDGALYIFAQNIDLGPEPEKKRQFEQIVPRAGKATITVEGMKADTPIEVIDEDRVLTAEEGRFTDNFAPLAEHIYTLRL